MLFPKLLETLQNIQAQPLPESREVVLKQLQDYVQQKVDNVLPIRLNFICTHNSRRSQFSQVWAQTLGHHFGIRLEAYSGGVEVTECNPRALASMLRTGFKIHSEGDINPIHAISFAEEAKPIQVFSKIFDDAVNPKESFAAIMTCSEADENCPFIPGAEKRIPLRYEDPKLFDGTPQEAEAYDSRSLQIATELYYVFSKITLP